ncbi:MAG: AarF/ABC1/UbiB kinase family protein [Actinobacteria bacterium]|nr:AarF/ABC1/UbiB kinase family protein [Actinomycetota bacterium]
MTATATVPAELDAPAAANALSTGPKLVIRSITLPTPTKSDVRRRLRQAVRVTARRLGPLFGLAARRQPVSNAEIAEALRKMFDDMGGTFSKFGQLIGSAPSLFGDDVAGAFRSTLDDVVPIPFHDVKLAVEDEFGLPMSQLFSAFDEEPIAAASLAAVHRAVLPDGRVVAVKVLRPGIEYKMAVDLAVMHPLFDFLGHQVAIGVLGEFPALISGLQEQLSEELDLRNEARSMRWFEHLCQVLELDRLEIPLPIDGYAGKRVLAMTFVDGVPVDDVEAIAAQGVDPAPLVQDCVKAWFASALCTGAFHGDVHAGNVMITTDGKLGVLDWGIVGRFDADTQIFFRRVIEGAMGDESAWVDVWKYAEAASGPGLQESLGLTDEQMITVVRMQVEPIFHRPFGEVKLSDMIMTTETMRDMVGAGDSDAPQRRNPYQRWRSERQFRRDQRDSGVRETSFDRSMFLLGKQLVYFERYGRLFLPDTPLLWDRSAFERLLAEPVVIAEVPFE